MYTVTSYMYNISYIQDKYINIKNFHKTTYQKQSLVWSTSMWLLCSQANDMVKDENLKPNISDLQTLWTEYAARK